MGAIKKAKPVFWAKAAVWSGLPLMLIPSASKKSAAPDFEETARFPCLMTGWPQASATMADNDEMLKLPFPSPPVPTISAWPEIFSGNDFFFLKNYII